MATILITDRTSQDVAYARLVVEAVQKGGAIPPDYYNLKGCPNLSDINRIENNTKFLAKKLYEYGYNANVVFRPTTTIKIEELFSMTGAEQTFTCPMDGTYNFEICGARGSGGNTYGTSFTPIGGKGARLTASFNLVKGDVLRLIVGGQGACIQATAKDGTSGGGGGCSMVLRNIDTITDNRYQFTKVTPFETLLVAAGGCGSNDCAYQNRQTDGFDGQAVAYKSLANFAAHSATTNSGTSSSGGTMGINQYISYSAIGARYTRANGVAQGGYGGGGAADDSNSYGGGWSNGSVTYSAVSWSLDEEAIGTDGVNDADGYVKITATIVKINEWTEAEVIFKPDVDRIRQNIVELKKAYYTMPGSPDIRFWNSLDWVDANSLEQNLQNIYILLDLMVASFIKSGTIKSGQKFAF